MYDRDGIDDCMVITRSNKRSNIYNDGIRNRILYREEELSTGDMLMITKIITFGQRISIRLIFWQTENW